MAIKLLAMDVDGTLTDGKINIGVNGELFKSFDVRDGYGIKHLCENYGIITAVITARSSEIVEFRSKELGVKEIHQGIFDKREKLIDLSSKYGLNPDQIAYIGDDVNDLPAISFAGMTFAPRNAHPDVKKEVDYILNSDGGHGAVRECIDLIINKLKSDVK
ncbi:3-deoxy-D-manno-octulosonate 8-phosphate phosphatase KdsC [bioreactor metagenome]|uniref:3-deoxy-D-manno-octulosonate 8-phosphate phosphatase KdsC n=1 Tax=bioreactor metagenome TaxID=1076179 RepID=A0A645H7N9_9ZZZZ